MIDEQPMVDEPMVDEPMIEEPMIDEDHLRKVVWWASVFVIATYCVVLLPPWWVKVLAGREMAFETLGSILFLVASVFFFRAFRAVGRQDSRDTQSRWRRVAYGLLALLLFVACGEELSWGQHLLGFEPPESIKELNAQQEFNLHNLWLLDSFGPEGEKKAGWRSLVNSNRLFDYFMITLLWLLPWAHHVLPRVGNWIDRFGGPVVPRSLGLLLALTFGLTIVLELVIVDGMFLHLAISEIRELSYALFCSIAAWILWRKEANGLR